MRSSSLWGGDQNSPLTSTLSLAKRKTGGDGTGQVAQLCAFLRKPARRPLGEAQSNPGRQHRGAVGTCCKTVAVWMKPRKQYPQKRTGPKHGVRTAVQQAQAGGKWKLTLASICSVLRLKTQPNRGSPSPSLFRSPISCLYFPCLLLLKGKQGHMTCTFLLQFRQRMSSLQSLELCKHPQ